MLMMSPMGILIDRVRTRTPSVNIRAERAGLLRALRYADAAAFDVACHLRDAGWHWKAIRAWCKAQKISALRWAQDKRNSPITKRWLDEHAAFADRFDEFVETWKWAQTLPASPTRKPSLHMFMDLMDSKRQHDTYSKARREMYLGKVTRTTVPVLTPERTQSVGPETLTPTTRLMVGEVVVILRQHVADEAADVAIADVPYFLRQQEHHVVDYYLAVNGMKPRFHAHWDRFESVQDYELHAEQWLHETMRCLNAEGSAFITGTYHNLGLISRLCQIKGYGIINKINWIVRNSRPQVGRTRLQCSYQEALWIAKDLDHFRYNYRLCKRNEYPGDYLARRNAQLRDSWDILSNGHENKGYGHPSPKPLGLYMRMLDCAGKPGGLLLDLFSGSGTGAIAAMRWGMESLSIEREPEYAEMIQRRVADELHRPIDF